MNVRVATGPGLQPRRSESLEETSGPRSQPAPAARAADGFGPASNTAKALVLGEEAPVVPAKPADAIYQVQSPAARAESMALARTLVSHGKGVDPKSVERLLTDMSALPAPVLQLLKNDELSIYILAEGQSLADTPWLQTIKPEDYQRLAARGKALFDEVASAVNGEIDAEVAKSKTEGTDDEFRIAMMRHWAGRDIGERLSARLIEEQLGFSLLTVEKPTPLRELAASRGIPEENFEVWAQTLAELNGGHVTIQDGVLEAEQGVALLPFTYFRGRPVSEASLQSGQQQTSQHVKDALGIYLPQNCVIILHDQVTLDPGFECGHHRVALHELGHALDYALERSPGYGEKHAARVKELFEKDKLDLMTGKANRFVSPRASENRRDYYAESLEAYLTVRMNDGMDFFAPGSNHENLAAINPDLCALFEQELNEAYPADLMPAAP